jgi:phosphatidylinositol phospholipase C epsilon
VAKFSLDSPPIHTTSLTYHYREKFRRNRNHQNQIHSENELFTPNKHLVKPAITHSSQMDFIEFMELFRSFLIRSRRDIKDIFEQIATKSDFLSFNETESLTTTNTGLNDINPSPLSSNSEKSNNYLNFNEFNTNKSTKKLLGLLTRNSPFDQNEEAYQKTRICDAIAAASIVANSAGIDTLKTLLLTATDFHAFIITYQCENLTLDEVKALIRMHEPNPTIRKRNCLSFEGFAKYLMDKDNYAYSPELFEINENDMNETLSHYYIASSHNTYLTGHQLKGESSVELYSQVTIIFIILTVNLFLFIINL